MAGRISAIVAAVLAQAAAPAPTAPPVSDQIAAARQEGETLLRDAHARGLFVNETGDPSGPAEEIRLRHRASGYLCTFKPGDLSNRITVFRSLTPGYDVGCERRGPAAVESLYIFHAPEKTAEQLLGDAEVEVRAGDAGAHDFRQFSDPLALGGPVGAPPHVSASLMSPSRGYRIVLGKLGDWAVETRFTGDPMVAESRVLDPLWLLTVTEGQRHGPVAGAATPEAAAPVSREALQSEALILIARSNSPDLFESTTDDKVIKIRHRPSGFTCSFDPGKSENNLQVFGGTRRGDDIGCSSRIGPMVVSYFVTRFPNVVPTPEQAMQLYMRDIRRMHPDVAAAKGPFVNANITPKPGEPPPPARLVAHLAYVDHGEAAYSRVCVSVVNGWVVEQRITTAMSQAQVADFVGEIGMIAATSKMAREKVT